MLADSPIHSARLILFLADSQGPSTRLSHTHSPIVFYCKGIKAVSFSIVHDESIRASNLWNRVDQPYDRHTACSNYQYKNRIRQSLADLGGKAGTSVRLGKRPPSWKTIC